MCHYLGACSGRILERCVTDACAAEITQAAFCLKSNPTSDASRGALSKTGPATACALARRSGDCIEAFGLDNQEQFKRRSCWPQHTTLPNCAANREETVSCRPAPRPDNGRCLMVKPLARIDWMTDDTRCRSVVRRRCPICTWRCEAGPSGQRHLSRHPDGPQPPAFLDPHHLGIRGLGHHTPLGRQTRELATTVTKILPTLHQPLILPVSPKRPASIAG